MGVKCFILGMIWLLGASNGALAADRQNHSDFGRQGWYAAAALAVAGGLYYKYSSWQESKLDAIRKPYSVNLMWINHKVNAAQVTIFPDGQSQQYVKKVLGWARKNPVCEINLWFDGALVSSQAVSNTRLEILNQAKQIGVDASKVTLRDVRDLRIVQENLEAFDWELPVYFRVDLLRVIALYDLIVRSKESWAVYADLDLSPRNKKQIFDRSTVANLNKYGFVMGKENKGMKFENWFQIFAYDINLAQAIKVKLIDDNLDRGKRFLEQLQGSGLSYDLRNRRLYRAHFQQTVYFSYPAMHYYLSQLRGQVAFDKKKPEDEAIRTACGYDIFALDIKACTHLINFPIPVKRAGFFLVSTSGGFEFKSGV